jgi:2-polyprenyl-3-methyl-5-hydroxy-6-metoxy-1,4-benzoquinol methylase
MLEKFNGQKRVCPWWLCYAIDNPLRKLIHHPEKMLSPYVKAGQRVIDIGPGMGYFSIPLARMVDPSGHVTAIDIQEKILAALNRRAQKYGVSEIISTYLASPDSLGSHTPVDFVLTFWMVHEVPDQKRFLNEIYGLLKPNGLFLLVEPKQHVSEKLFLQTLETAKKAGFLIKENPKINLSYSALLIRDKNS